MQSDDPPFLCLGTEVSAKFKGAFCEAKVKKLVKSIRCKVNLGSEFGTIVVEDKDIKGTIILNGNVDVMQGKHIRAGVIQHIKDCSQYTVVFNDGDERNLRRTQVCLKSGRHFEPEVSLDSLPLYNPEHFSNPVMHGNKKRNRQMSVDRSPRKRKAKDDDDEDEEEEAEKRKKKRAASMAASAAMADQGGSTESGEEKEEESGSEGESERGKSEKKKKVEKVKTPEVSPAKKRKEERDEEKRKKEKEKEEEKKRKEKEDKKKEKEELKKKEKEEERRKDEKKEKKEKSEKEEKKSKTEDKTEKVKGKDASPKKDKASGKEKAESSTKKETKETSFIEQETKKPGVAVVIAMRKDRESTTYYPALTVAHDAYEKYCPRDKVKTVKEGQLVVKSFVTDSYARVSIVNCSLFESFEMDEFFKEKVTSRLKAAISLATTWNNKKRLPKEWKLAEIFGDEEARKMEKEKLKKRKEEEKRKEREEEERQLEEEKKKKEKEEERKREEEEERKKKELEERKKREKEEEKKREKEEEKKEREREKEKKEKEKEKEREKEKEKEKDKKTKKPVEPESSSEESESSDEDEADNQERDIFTAQLYKFHEERNTPINKAPVWGGKDLDLHKLYRYVIRYGGSKKCTDSSLWKKILVKLKLGDTGAQPVNVKKAYLRYLNEFHSTYSQLGWSLDDLSTKIVSGGRSAKKVIDYGFRKRRRDNTEKRQSKRLEKDESIRSGGTTENYEDDKVKKEERETSLRPADVSSIDTNSRRSLSRITHSESPMQSTSAPAKRGRKGKGSKEESVARTVSECTEPALTPAVGEDASSTVSSSAIAAFAASSSPAPHEGSTWAHDDAKDSFLPANILSHFYQGMTVRALHSGQWYAARVVKVQQPSIKVITDAINRAAGGVAKFEPGESFGLNSMDELREITKKIRCLVHYLGWNSRYDENIKLPQIRINQKDEDVSMNKARPNLSEDLLLWVSKWSRTREGMTALCGPLESPKDSSSMMIGGYRQRRLSVSFSQSQFEQLSTSATSPMGGTISPSMSEREKKERRSEETAVKMKSEEREEERREEEEEAPKSVTPVVEKKEKKKTEIKEEPEKKEDEKEEKEERVEKEEKKEKETEKKKKEEVEESKSKRIGVPKRTPSPSKLASLAPSSSAEAVPVVSSVPPPPPPIPAATPSTSAAATAVQPSTPTPVVQEKEVEKKGSCSISDTIDEVVLLLGSRAEKEKKERLERERREQMEAERIRKEKEAVVALMANVAAKQKEDEDAAGPSKGEDTVDAERSMDEMTAKKEVRFEKAERKKGGKDREWEPEVKKKKKKEDEKEKKKSPKRVEKKREEEEEEEEAIDDEEEHFERLHKEARSMGIRIADLADESTEKEEKKGETAEVAEKEAIVVKEETEEKYHSDSSLKTFSTTIDKSAPPSSGKGKKRKKKGNQSNMVLDRKYSKRSKKEEEDDSDEEDAAVLSERPPHATLSVLKNRMLKAMEADGSLGDFSPIGMPHITHSNLYGEKVLCNWSQLEKHAEELREYYYGVRAELAKLEKRNKATIKRRIEKDRSEREARKAAKEAAAAAADDAAASGPSASVALTEEA